MTSTRLVHCTFPKNMIREPLLYNLGRDFKIVPNIRGATISDEIGLVYLELEGPEPEIEKAVAFLAERGVTIETVAGGMPADGLPPPSPTT
ncbi:MAG: NIL domain-containing protein [Planctomycetota bacterium]|jgi:ABC-type methionine transport system ATPase subunit